MTPSTMDKTFGIRTAPSFKYSAKSEVTYPGQTDLDESWGSNHNQTVYNNDIMPKYCFAEVGTDPSETCPPYLDDPTTKAPRKTCSRLVSLGVGGDLCRDWQAQNTQDTVSTYMVKYCSAHPANGDCDCLEATNPKNPLNEIFKSGGQIAEANPECFWKPCTTGYSRNYLQTTRYTQEKNCPSICATITKNMADNGAQINSTTSSVIACDFSGSGTTPTPTPTPNTPSSSHWLVWTIVAIGILLFVVLIVLVVIVSMRSKKGKSQPTK